MKKLHSFVIKSYIGPFIATFFIAEFILLMQFLWLYIDDLVGKGLSFWVLVKLFAYMGASLVPMAMPIAVLLSSIMTFGNLGEHYELTAIKSAGISLLQTMKPLIIVNIFLSIASFAFYNNVMPYANLKAKSLLWDIKQQRLDINIREGVFYNGIDDYSIKVAKKDVKTGVLYDMMIYNHSNNQGNTEITRADSGFIKMTDDKKYLLVHLYNGIKYQELPEENPRKQNKTNPAQKEKFDEETLVFRLKGFGLKRTDENQFKAHYEMMNIKQLRHQIDSLEQDLKKDKQQLITNLQHNNLFKKEKKKKTDTINKKPDYNSLKLLNIDSIFNTRTKQEKIRIINMATNFARSTKTYIRSSLEGIELRKKFIIRHYVEWNKKMSVPVACFILFFIGAPMGAIIRKGGLGWPVVVSIFFFLLYYVISIIAEKSVKEGVIPVVVGIWLSSAVLLPIGIFLTIKANNDSVLFDKAKYLEFFGKIFRFIKSIFIKNKNHHKK